MVLKMYNCIWKLDFAKWIMDYGYIVNNLHYDGYEWT